MVNVVKNMLGKAKGVLKEDIIYSESFGGIMLRTEYYNDRYREKDGKGGYFIYAKKGTKLEKDAEGWFDPKTGRDFDSSMVKRLK